MMVVLLSLDLAQAVLADDVPDFQETLQTAEQGFAQAQYNLGNMYANGQGVRQDYAQAVQWFGKAAEQGFAYAQFNLGLMYAKGQGVHQDDAQAVQWYRKAAEQGDAKATASNYRLTWTYRKAAEQGDAKAQFNLGVMYEEGKGVRQNLVIAKEWFGKACDNGLQQGCDAYRELNQAGY